MTIVISYNNSDPAETYSSVTNVTESGGFLRFNGQLQGQGEAKDWRINLTNVKKWSEETEGD